MKLEDVDPLDPDIVECPYEFYRALRERGVYRVPQRGFFLVGNYDTAMQVIKDTDTFSSKSGVAVPRTPERPRDQGLVFQMLEVGGDRCGCGQDSPAHRQLVLS